MSPLNEAETRAKLIDPKIKTSGWGESLIEREHFFIKGRPITAGRIYLVGEESRRRPSNRVDYLLRYRGEMVAVLEAKDESQSVDAGLEQAKAYAEQLDIPFAYSSNGHGFIEFDFFDNQSRECSVFPGPDELWSRWQAYLFPSNQETILKAAEASSATYNDPLLLMILFFFQFVQLQNVERNCIIFKKSLFVELLRGLCAGKSECCWLWLLVQARLLLPFRLFGNLKNQG